MAELIPRDVLFGNAGRLTPRLSPDGTRLAWLAPDDGVLNLWMAPIDAADGVNWAAAQVLTADRDRGIRSYAWAQDDRHLLYVQDSGGDENWRLYDVDLVTMQHRDLTPYENVKVGLLARDRKFPTDVLITMNRDDVKLHDVYRLDLISGELTLEVKNPGFVGWLTDTQLVVRAGVEVQPDGGYILYVRDDGDAPWRPLLTIPGDDAPGTSLVSFSEDGQSLLMTTAVDAEASRLIRIDVNSGAVEVLVEDPAYDVTSVHTQPDTRMPQIAVLNKARAEYVVLDPAVAEDLAAIRSLHSGDPMIVSWDRTDTTWLVIYTTDTGPVPFFSYHRPSRTGRFLFTHRPELAKYELGAMEPFEFTARDGLTVHGYLTFPVGVERRNLPAVVNVHGGPAVRDLWGFDLRSQWMANRGYLAIQVNYRGSTGYGKSFVTAGDREWGGKMHTDLLDAVNYVTGQGWADPGRIAIFGGSYGGYAALVGAAFTPDVFRCAVDLCGPSNLKTLIETVPPYWAPLIARLHRRVGDPVKEPDFLWSRSPLSRVRDIRIPLLIAQGANDPRVKQAEAEQIVAALQEAGIEYEYLLFPDEGHGLVKPANRMIFYAAAERFLARYLGGRAEE